MDAAKFFDTLKGPEVKGVNDTQADAAKQAEDAGNFQRAAQIYKTLMDTKPSDSALALKYANAMRRAGQCNNAAVTYQQLIDKDPKNLDALEGKGFCQMTFGEAKEASKTFEAVLAQDKNRWRTLNATGILFASRGKVSESLAYFDAAKNASEGQVAVLNNLGIAQLLNQNYAEAITTLGQAARKLPSNNPDVARVNTNLALAHALSGNMEQSEAILRQHLSEEAAYNNLGYFAKLKDNKQLATDYLNMALTKSDGYYKRAWENLEQVKAE